MPQQLQHTTDTWIGQAPSPLWCCHRRQQPLPFLNFCVMETNEQGKYSELYSRRL